MERFDDICPENEFEDKNYNEEYDREYSFDQGYEWTEEDVWDALTDGMYGDMPSNPLEYDWRKRSIPTHSGWLYPLTFDAGKGLKEA